ncbi:MAG: amidohydrolase [Lachnospiraceae bacterium]|nr:amidohydrolase [Lachnospiraceae bacterium]
MSNKYIVKGKVYTGHDNDILSYADAFFVKNGVIGHVGSFDEVKAYDKLDGNGLAKILDFGDSFISPGFTDGHAHISFAKTLVGGIELASGKSIEDYIGLMRQFKEKHPELTFVRGQGYSPNVFPETGPTKEIIDEVYPDIPVVLQSDGLHESWVNSAFLKYAGINADTPDVANGTIVRDETGEPTGSFLEEATDIVMEHCPEATVEQYKKAIIYFQEKVLPYGTINVFEPIINDEVVVKAYKELIDEGRLKLKVRAGYKLNQEDDVDEALLKIKSLNSIIEDERFEINAVKLFMDGVVENHTAFLLEPYLDIPDFVGDALWEQEPLNEAVLKILDAGYAIHTHAIGDGGVERILQAFEYAVPKTKNKELRNVITHLQVVDPSHYERMAKLNIIGVVNTFWHFKTHSYYFTRELPWLGHERVDIEYPLRSLFDAGVLLSQASDWPVSEPPEALHGLEIGLTRKAPGSPDDSPLNENEAMNIADMYDVITKNGAYQLGTEDENGTLEIGKKADFVVLDNNPFETDVYDIHAIKVNNVFIDGEEVYRR